MTTSFYYPQSNGLIERYHRTLVDVLSKKNHSEAGTWDTYLNPALAAIRFRVNDSTGCSPFRLLYNREVVMPIDTILRRHRKYLGEDGHCIALKQQHKAFLLVHRNRRLALKKRNYYANRKSSDIAFTVGDLVYYRNTARKNKLDVKWQPYYLVLEKTSPVTYIVKNNN